MKLSNILLNQYNQFKNLESLIKENGIKFKFSEFDLPFEQLASLGIDYEKRLTSIDLPLLCYHNDKLLFEGIIKFNIINHNFFKRLKNKINKFNSVNITEFINDEYEGENELFVFNSPIKEFYEKSLNWISHKEVEPKYNEKGIEILELNADLYYCLYYKILNGKYVADCVKYDDVKPFYEIFVDKNRILIKGIIIGMEGNYYCYEYKTEQDAKNELNRLRRCQPIDYHVDLSHYKDYFDDDGMNGEILGLDCDD